MVHIPVKYHPESFYGIFYIDHYTRYSRELFSYRKRLGKEPLDASGTVDGQTIFIREFIHPKNGNDVLQFLVALEYLFHALGYIVMLFAYNIRVEDA